MEAKDTVMTDGEIMKLWEEYEADADRQSAPVYHYTLGHITYPWRVALKAQAEISFKAGQEYAISKQGYEAISFLEGYQKGGQERAREVVEFIQRCLPDPEEYIDPELWQAKLKDWGL